MLSTTRGNCKCGASPRNDYTVIFISFFPCLPLEGHLGDVCEHVFWNASLEITTDTVLRMSENQPCDSTEQSLPFSLPFLFLLSVSSTSFFPLLPLKQWVPAIWQWGAEGERAVALRIPPRGRSAPTLITIDQMQARWAMGLMENSCCKYVFPLMHCVFPFLY